jgi:hypothetical protein
MAPGVPVAARGAAIREKKGAGDVESVRSWVGSMRSVSMGSMRSTVPGFGWMRKEELDEGEYFGRSNLTVRHDIARVISILRADTGVAHSSSIRF